MRTSRRASQFTLSFGKTESIPVIYLINGSLAQHFRTTFDRPKTVQ